ncbi:MAG: aspartate-semialdehyde dehydrogenase [Chloroflexi bacterium]|nr:aspartate-semialdehyde dehydrogenase [Chloroflexota bacterium]MQC16666.1 aspartate-semialdehyde dehydrogenase [Chloroflexota bacterium]
MEPTVAVIGATGAVGEVFLRVAAERKFPMKKLKLLASSRSAGKVLRYDGPLADAPNGADIVVEETTEAALEDVDIVFCAASSDVSKQWAPWLRERGKVLVDKSSAFRQDPTVPLVIPEVNGDDLERHQGVVATPNCTTTPMAMALNALRSVSPLKHVIVATYQAVSGTGADAVDEMAAQIEAIGRGNPVPAPEVYPVQIAGNVLPHVDDFVADEDYYTKEELKMRNETRKILHQEGLPVAATCVRVPVEVGHAEVVHVEFEGPYQMGDLIAALQAQPGLVVETDPTKYLTPLQIAGDDRAFVSRLRRDPTAEYGVTFWCMTDNLRKGAALNAIQIAEEMLKRNLVFDWNKVKA